MYVIEEIEVSAGYCVHDNNRGKVSMCLVPSLSNSKNGVQVHSFLLRVMYIIKLCSKKKREVETTHFLCHRLVSGWIIPTRYLPIKIKTKNFLRINQKEKRTTDCQVYPSYSLVLRKTSTFLVKFL